MTFIFSHPSNAEILNHRYACYAGLTSYAKLPCILRLHSTAGRATWLQRHSSNLTCDVSHQPDEPYRIKPRACHATSRHASATAHHAAGTSYHTTSHHARHTKPFHILPRHATRQPRQIMPTPRVRHVTSHHATLRQVLHLELVARRLHHRRRIQLLRRCRYGKAEKGEPRHQRRERPQQACVQGLTLDSFRLILAGWLLIVYGCTITHSLHPPHQTG